MTDQIKTIRLWAMSRCQFIQYDHAKDGNGYSVITMDCHRPIEDKCYLDSIHWNSILNYYCKRMDELGYSSYFIDDVYYIDYNNDDLIRFIGDYAEEHWQYFNDKLEKAKSLAVTKN